MIEGVMMRNKEKFAVAVRLKNSQIKVKKETSSKYPKFFQVFFVRGIIGLGYMLYDGMRALSWSSNQQLERKERITKTELILTLLLSLVFALVLFVGIPFISAWLIHSEGFLFDFLDGVFRILIFIGYLLVISLMSDVKTLFRYHGAEHKTIGCYEAGKRLTVENVRRFSRLNPRCGTSFLFMVIILSLFLFSLINGAWWIKLLGRILFLPVIAGLGYEMVKFSNKHCGNPFLKAFISPGLWLQKITTREPNNKQIEVAIKALQEVLN